MKNTRYRSIIIDIVVCFFFAGIGFFLFEFITNSRQWAFSPVNRHLSEGNMSGGKILDTNNIILAQTLDGKRVYNEKEDIRKAMLHTVGDGSVLIPTSVQSRYNSELFGYNPVIGFGAPHVFDINQNIKLTLDSEICAKVSKSFKDKKGAALAYNYLTGEILCMVSLPTYDVNSRPTLDENIKDKYEGMYINRAISSSFTPGSIFKIFTTAAALDLIPDVEKRTFECKKVKIIDGEKVTCMSSHGKINLKDAMSKSCDIVFSDIAIELGKEKMKSKMEEYGLNAPEYFDGMQVISSSYDVNDASKAELGWSGIGQSKDKVSPFYMLKVMGAIANKGIHVEPFIVKSVFTDSSGEYHNNSKNLSKRMFSETTAESLKEIMRYTMKNQYKDSMFGGIQMCAKTGTAEVGEDKLPHGWMVGFSYDKTFPVAFSVIVENGDFGIKSAGPIAADMIKEFHRAFKAGKYEKK